MVVAETLCFAIVILGKVNTSHTISMFVKATAAERTEDARYNRLRALLLEKEV